MNNINSIGDFILPIFSIIGGCCSNAYALELIASRASNCGTLLTFCQFLSVVLLELPGNLDPKMSGLFKKRIVPIQWWAFSVLLFFGSSLLNNVAFKFNVPVPLHIVFRSGSMLANMLIGCVAMKKVYKKMQVFSVSIVTIGIILATLGSTEKESTKNDIQNNTLLIGMIILTVAMFMGAGLGVVQEIIYKKFGKSCWKEGLFYTHFLSLPLFFIFSSSIKNQLERFMDSEKIQLTQNNHIPSLVLYLLINCMTQLFCVSGVQKMSSLASSLTLNLVLTIRKMVSIVFSVWYFKKNITTEFAVGTTMVLVGTLIYTNANSNKKSTEKKQKN